MCFCDWSMCSAPHMNVSHIIVMPIWSVLWLHLWPLTPALFTVPYDGPVCDSRYCPSLPLLLPGLSSLPHPKPYTPPSNTETDQPSLVWFDRGKFYLTFEGKLRFMSKDVARVHSSLIWSPFLSCIHLSFICFTTSQHLLCSLYLVGHHVDHFAFMGSLYFLSGSSCFH